MVWPPMYKLVNRKTTPPEHVRSDSYGHRTDHPDLIVEHRSTAARTTYACELCNESFSTRDSRDAHCKCDNHLDRTKALRSSQENYVWTRCAQLQNRIGVSLPSNSFGKASVESKIAKMLTCYAPACKSNVHSELGFSGTLNWVYTSMEAYEDQIRFGLLTLAAWKAVCISNPIPGDASSTCTYYEWLEWCHQGWKGRKDELRGSREIGTVVRLVRHFVATLSKRQHLEPSWCAGVATKPRLQDLALRAYKNIHRNKSVFEQDCCTVVIKMSSHGKSYVCELCSVVLATATACHDHKELFGHQVRELQLALMRENGIVWSCCELQKRIDLIPSLSWRVDVESRIGTLLLTHFYNNVNDPDFAKEMTAAYALLESYENKERLVCLELAAWRAVCLLSFLPPVVPSSAPTNIYEWHHWWHRQGWREAKTAMRNCNEMGIIVGAVRLFMV